MFRYRNQDKKKEVSTVRSDIHIVEISHVQRAFDGLGQEKPKVNSDLPVPEVWLVKVEAVPRDGCQKELATRLAQCAFF